MIDQLLAELRKMRSTRTNLGLLAGMVALILLTVLVNGLAAGHRPPHPRQPARAAVGRHLRRPVRLADRRDGDHERVPARHDPTDLRCHTAPRPRDRGEGDREPADGDRVRGTRDRAFVRDRLCDPRRQRSATSRSTRTMCLLLVLGSLGDDRAVGGARGRASAPWSRTRCSRWSA